MAIDLTGGQPLTRDFVFPAQPGPDVRDAANFWLEEENGAFAMRIGIEGWADHWHAHDIWLDVAFADGCVFHARESGTPPSPIDAAGNPTILGAGPVRLQCIEPFALWRATMDPHAVARTTATQLIDGNLPPADAPRQQVSFDIAFRPAAPPLVSGTLTAESRELMAGEQGSFISPRFEQLCRAEGWLAIDGERIAFKGQALRIKRQGVRKYEGFWGHCWQSALFPSGKAFGVNTFPPRDDGAPNFNEGFVFTGDGALKPAKAVSSPWLRRFLTHGEPVPLVLETEDGERHHIDGTTFIACRSVGPSILPPSFPLIQQAHATYTWDGERATGMIERSSFRAQMELD
ncbi:MAG: hypothetical protein KGM17_03730 [Sphingomonadales bacterium]|nr:hypothetical protein [Sphingomonadales bacterium]